LELLDSKPHFVQRFIKNMTGATAFTPTDFKTSEECLMSMIIRLNNVPMCEQTNLGKRVLLAYTVILATLLLKNFIIPKNTKTLFANLCQIAKEDNFVLSIMTRENNSKFCLTFKNSFL